MDEIKDGYERRIIAYYHENIGVLMLRKISQGYWWVSIGSEDVSFKGKDSLHSTLQEVINENNELVLFQYFEELMDWYKENFC